MDTNECTHCHLHENAFICFCQEVLMCEHCLTFHLLTNPSAAHKPVPLSSYQLMKEMHCEQKILQPVESASSNVREKLEAELLRLREFEASALDQLKQVRQQWVLQIHEAANEIEAILKVKCEAMAQDLRQSLEELEETGSTSTIPFFTKTPQSDAELLNLSFEVGKLDLNPLFKQFFSVSLNYTQEKHQDNFLYKLFGGQPTLAVFDPASESVLSFRTLSERLLHNSCWIMSDDGNLLITGGSISGACRKDVLKYNPTQEKLEKLTPMNSARRSHACILHAGKMFVFGGIREEENLKECEALDFDSGVWTAACDLRTPRGQLGAVEHEGVAYIVGGCQVAEIEIYDFARDCFDAVLLPGPWLLEGCSLLSLDNSLLILHGNYKGEMFLFQPDTCSLQKVCDVCHGNSWSNCMPVVQGKVLYMLRVDSIFKLDLETHKSAYVLKITKTAKKRKTTPCEDE